ncbi:hypothetical protein MPTK2_8g15330 [Marchantia polymorpha subsp. ruderalis]
MEIAGASVCRGAELATRGMDSADVEPELPSAVQDLIRCLEGKADPSMQLRNLHRAEFQDFFPKTLRELTEWRRRVRKRVLEAIRSCKTFKYIDMKDIFRGDISRLEAEEWVFILEGFRSSTALRVIRVEGLTWTSIAEVEGFCLQVGKILKTSSVTHLTVGSCRLSATCFRNLATGLHGNSPSMLKSIELHNAWEDSSALEHVADIIKNATRLETLEIGGSADRMYDMDGEAARILSQALILSLSLKTLVLKEAKGVLSALLLKALSGDDVNRSIECLHLISVSGLGDCLRELLSSNPFLKDVTLTNIDMGSEKWRQLGEAIRENATARSICVTHRRDDLKAAEELACAASPKDTTSSVGKDPTVELTITFTDYQALMSALNFVDRVLRGDIKSLKSLILVLKIEAGSCPSGSDEHSKNGGVTMEGKTETSVLESLKLFAQSKDIFKAVWKDLLPGLQGNTSLTRLDLSNSELDDEAFRDLMRLLQGNSALQEIIVSGTSWASDGKALQIHRALQNKNEKNKERAVYMSVFGEANLKFGDAKAGRLFLCGSPRAGKTQLRKTVMRINQGKSCLGKSCLCSECDELSSTKGIEVEVVQNDDKMQISVWDLGGERIFRTLQTLLFPQTNYFCAFVFVYSPFCEDICEGEDSPSNKDYSVRFKTELKEWLIFITSNARVSGDLPQVFIVISHKNKSTDNSLSWTVFQPIVEELTKTFANFVYLHPIGKDFHVDTRENKQVHSLYINICQKFDNLLTRKFLQVPELCSQLNSLLVTYTKKNKSFPLWPTKKFYDFCVPILVKFYPLSSAHSYDYSRMMKPIISYLNEVGTIIYIPNLDYIIVDPNWLTNTFLGELIDLGQHFQTQESKSSKDGFVSEKFFAVLIEKFLGKLSRYHVDRWVLEKILINLDMCFKLENTSEYFIPFFIPEHASKEKHNDLEGAHVMKWENRSEISQFVGIRIQCQDWTTMSLTAAFFPRFQMFMRRKLISEMAVSEENVICSRHYLLLFLDGHQIYIEHVQSEKSSKYVDVLMSSQKSREEAITYVRKHIVQELISFCASPQGCPGVALVLGVIQTFCVKKLIRIHLRGTILIEKLKLDFKNSINDKLEKMPLERSHLMENEKLFHYEQSWPSIDKHIGESLERARDLLSESDVKAIVNEIQQERDNRLLTLDV